MKNGPRNLKQILSRNISGFHQYCLDGTPRPVYVSQNLCDMLALTEEELLDEKSDRYAARIHPANRQSYDDFLKALRQKEHSATIQYRILKKDGSILYVSDTMVSYYRDGMMMGDSVLTDITELKRGNQILNFLNETMPCGFIKYTCEKQPKVTYINDQMRQFLRIPQSQNGELDDLEMYKQNIYMMIPIEERRRFSVYLDRVYKHSAPIAGEMTVLRCDGTRGYLFGWVTKCVNEEGVEEFQSACMDITEQHHIRKERETRRYLKALTDVYDKIFEYDLDNRTVKCLYGQHSPMFRWIENIPVQMEDATDKWIVGTVFEEDRDRVREFLLISTGRKLHREKPHRRFDIGRCPPTVH